MNEESELGIFEAGISEMGEMRPLQNMIKPTIGILTNIGGAHTGKLLFTAREVHGKTKPV
jgi:UDP-N-acetylmuramyl pentapeptide synthase